MHRGRPVSSKTSKDGVFQELVLDPEAILDTVLERNKLERDRAVNRDSGAETVWRRISRLNHSDTERRKGAKAVVKEVVYYYEPENEY